MANPDQLAILKQGVGVWNAWRKEHAEEKIDLREANLTWANLTWANLTRANLGVADLWDANLVVADLTRADLTGANLTHADLVHTHLEHAVLTGCRIFGISACDLKTARSRRPAAGSLRLHRAGRGHALQRAAQPSRRPDAGAPV